MAIITASLILLIVIFVVVFLITKKILKTIIFGILITIILLGVSGFVIFNDAKNFIENFPNNENKLVFILNNKIVGGMNVKGLDFSESYKDNVNILNSNEIKELNNNYPNNLKNVLGESYKLFIVDANIISESFINDTEADINYLPNNGKEILTIIKQEDSLSYYYKEYLKSQGLSETEINILKKEINNNKDLSLVFENSESFRNYLVLSHFINLVNNNPTFILENFIDNKIIMYPETIVIKIIKDIPSVASKLIS